MHEDQTPYWNADGPKEYSETDIDAAIEAGIISHESARELKELVLRSLDSSKVDEEHFRLVGGLNDIFVSVICGIFFVAIYALLYTNYSPGLAGMVLAGSAWGLTEYFVRKKHLALTAIVLLSGFAGGLFFSVFEMSESVTGASMVTGLGAWLHWRRFHVPISVACGHAAIVALCLSMLVQVSALENYITLFFFCAGLATLALAMYWDSSDLNRLTRRSDVAFWLHLLAAPLLVHPVFLWSGIITEGIPDLTRAWGVLLLYAVLISISLIIDRRALILSALGYVLYACNIIFKSVGDSLGYRTFALSALVTASILLLLAAFWNSSRALIVRNLSTGLQRRLPGIQKNNGPAATLRRTVEAQNRSGNSN